MRRLPEEAEEDDAAGVIVGLDLCGKLMMNHCGWCQDFQKKRWTMIIPNQNEVKLHHFIPFISKSNHVEGEARKQV